MLLSFLLYLLVGIIAGSASGLLGIGGGVVVVPLLNWIFRYNGFPLATNMHMAVGTSLAAMIVTTTSSMIAHHRQGAEIWPIFKRFLIGIIIGTICGAIIADFLHSRVLSIIFGILILLIALEMLFISPKAKRHLPGIRGFSLTAFLIGGISGLTGLGGGVLSIPFMTYCRVKVRQAIGVSTACGLVIALTGTVSFIITGLNESGLPHLSAGYVYWPAVLGIVVMSPVFAVLGAAVSHRVSTRLLRGIFIVMLLVISIHMLLFG